MNIEKYLIPINATVMQTIDIIDKGARGIAFLCKGRRLLASVSDGDIRRYLLKNDDLQQSVLQVAEYHPYYLKENQSDMAMDFMRDKCITAIPIVDDDMNILDIKFLIWKKKSVIARLEIPLVIMAGGKGMRLRPYTDILPKPLFPLGDMTITEHIMEHFFCYGCNDVYMIINYKKEFIKSYFIDKNLEQRLTFLEEDEFLGTGGGLRLLCGKLKDTFFMTNCDILIEADYSEILKFHRQKHNLITMVCAKKEIKVPYGIVETGVEGLALSMQEKPSFFYNTNTGLYVIEPSFLDRIPENKPVHITDVIQGCIACGDRIGVYLISDEEWMDMGQFEELEKMKGRMGLV